MPVVGSAQMLMVTFRSSPDGPVVDPTDVSMTISFGSVVVVGPIVPPALVKIGVGRYEYGWNVPINATPGTYTVQWSGVLPGGTGPTLGYEVINITAAAAASADTTYSFITTAELRDYMSGIGLDADQAGAMQDVLDGLQRELERHCQRKFQVQAHIETITPDDSGRLWPKHTPVVDVLEPVGYTAAGNQISAYGAWEPSAVTVKYVAGLDPDDVHDVRQTILRIASREATVRHDDTLSVKDLEGRQAGPADREPLGWTEAELKKFDRLRRRTMA